MTNISSGSKRSWDGVEVESSKRQREREEPRDWRDVHLKSPRRNPPTNRRVGSDKRFPDERSRHGRPRSADHRRISDPSKERPRRDDRDRDRREDSRRDDFHRTPTSERDHRPPNGHPRHDDSEREEGE